MSLILKVTIYVVYLKILKTQIRVTGQLTPNHLTPRAVVGGTAMAVPLFGQIMIFKITHFEFSFPLFYYFLSF